MKSILCLLSLVANAVVFSNAEYPDELAFDYHLSNLDLEETCNLLTDKTECSTNYKCSWCTSGAVKSECHSVENAERLPINIFECDGLSYYKDIGGSFIDDNFADNFLSLQWHPKWNDYLEFVENNNKQYTASELENRFNDFLNDQHSFQLESSNYTDKVI